MCLYDKKRFRFTFKRIPIYKVVIRKDNDKLSSPFSGAFITKEMKGNIKYRPLKRNHFYIFGEGFIHACTTEKAAKILIEFLKTELYPEKNLHIIEGYIPAFTRYAINNSGGDICARRMILDI